MTAPTLDAWYRTPAVRFLIAGGANTAATGALVILLSLFLPGWLAFTISFALGIAFSVVMTSPFCRARRSFKLMDVCARNARTSTGALFTFFVSLRT